MLVGQHGASDKRILPKNVSNQRKNKIAAARAGGPVWGRWSLALVGASLKKRNDRIFPLIVQINITLTEVNVKQKIFSIRRLPIMAS